MVCIHLGRSTYDIDLRASIVRYPTTTIAYSSDHMWYVAVCVLCLVELIDKVRGPVLDAVSHSCGTIVCKAWLHFLKAKARLPGLCWFGLLRPADRRVCVSWCRLVYIHCDWGGEESAMVMLSGFQEKYSAPSV